MGLSKAGYINSYLKYTRGLLFILAIQMPSGLLYGAGEDAAIWRKLARASTTVHEVFLARTPQIVIFGNGLVVYRDDDFTSDYHHVELDNEDIAKLYLLMQGRFGLPSLTNEWLENELPYAKSIQRPFHDNNDIVTIWIGLHTPASLHTYSTDLLKARSVDSHVAPAWNAMYEFNLFLSDFTHPDATPYAPDRVEIAVQHLPRYMAEQSVDAVDWTLDSMDLQEIKGKRPRGYKTLIGQDAAKAYQLLTQHQVIRQGGQVYLVWVRPLLLS